VALLTCYTANINRDTEKRRKPFPITDFLVYGEVSEKQQPPAAAGAAMLELVKREQFPSFALAFFTELKQSGQGAALPPRLVWAADDALLLAPYRVDAQNWGGMLIAENSAAGENRCFWSETGDQCWMTVPADVAEMGEVVAVEGSILPIVGFQSSSDSESLQLQPSS
jgi:hypothetical protein